MFESLNLSSAKDHVNASQLDRSKDEGERCNFSCKACRVWKCDSMVKTLGIALGDV